MPLSPKQERFVEEYLIDLNATQAAIRAGYKPKNARIVAAQNLAKLNVQEAIAARRKVISERAEIDAAFVLMHWASVVQANESDLVQYRRGCCRHCWGDGFAYHWTQAELLAAQNHAVQIGKPAPDASGGVGFNKAREPNPECPECAGEGKGRIYVVDTRVIPDSAKPLFAGVRLSKDGLEVKMHDKGAALVNIAKHLGMFVERKELTGKDGKDLIPSNVYELTDEQLAAIAAGSSAGTDP